VGKFSCNVKIALLELKTRTCTIIMCDSLLVALVSVVHRDPLHPGCMCLKEFCCGVPQNSVYDAKCHGYFQFIKIRFLTMCTNILSLPWWEITSVRVRQPSTIQ